jgi:hypothetical protein
LTGFEKLAARTFSGIIEKHWKKTQFFFDFNDEKTAALMGISG